METEEQVAEFETVPRYVREAVELKTSVRKLYRKRSMRKKKKKKRNGNVAMNEEFKKLEEASEETGRRSCQVSNGPRRKATQVNHCKISVQETHIDCLRFWSQFKTEIENWASITQVATFSYLKEHFIPKNRAQ